MPCCASPSRRRGGGLRVGELLARVLDVEVADRVHEGVPAAGDAPALVDAGVDPLADLGEPIAQRALARALHRLPVAALGVERLADESPPWVGDAHRVDAALLCAAGEQGRDARDAEPEREPDHAEDPEARHDPDRRAGAGQQDRRRRHQRVGRPAVLEPLRQRVDHPMLHRFGTNAPRIREQVRHQKLLTTALNTLTIVAGSTAEYSAAFVASAMRLSVDSSASPP